MFLVWTLGRVSAAALNGGDGTLRPEMFRLLPIPVRKLARSLLAVAFVDASLLFVLIAFGSLVLYAAHYGAAVAAVATPLGAIPAKELRVWSRGTLRLTCLLIALFVGVLTSVISTLTSGSTFMLPWAGALTALIAGASACTSTAMTAAPSG